MAKTTSKVSDKYTKTIKARMDEQKARAVEYYREIPILKHAAAFAGFSQDTMTDWIKADPKFSDDLQQAKSEFIRRHGKKARPEFLLERLDKEHFKETSEVTHIIPQPILGGLSKEGDMDGTVPTDDSTNKDK